jgi:hypothetical protein
MSNAIGPAFNVFGGTSFDVASIATITKFKALGFRLAKEGVYHEKRS